MAVETVDSNDTVSMHINDVIMFAQLKDLLDCWMLGLEDDFKPEVVMLGRKRRCLDKFPT